MLKLFGGLVATLVISLSSLSAEEMEISLKRKRGTFLKGYYSYYETKKPAPLIVFLDGSTPESVYENHQKLALKFKEKGFAFVSLEKEGVTKDTFDESIHNKYDCLENRLSDYLLLFKELEKPTVLQKPSHIILMGASEGGKLASKLACLKKDRVDAVMLLASGGGLSFEEEMTAQIENLMNDTNTLQKTGYKIRKAFKPKEIQKQFEKIKKNPDSLKTYATKTYKWWASYFNYEPLNDLLDLDIPIYLLHGAKDRLVPVKSADLVVDAFKKKGKTNLQYARYLDLDHSLKGREDVYSDMLTFAEKSIQ